MRNFIELSCRVRKGGREEIFAMTTATWAASPEHEGTKWSLDDASYAFMACAERIRRAYLEQLEEPRGLQ